MLPDPEFTNELSVAQCRDFLGRETPPLLIDCREVHEYAHCRIEGSMLVPLSNFMGNAEAHFSKKDTPAIIYCHHGVRSLNAVYYLREQGYLHTYSMAGGIDAWSVEVDSSVARY